jgi:hypothetical protein
MLGDAEQSARHTGSVHVQGSDELIYFQLGQPEAGAFSLQDRFHNGDD